MDKCSQAPFAHRFPTLIHPLPTLRRVRKELTSDFSNNNIFLEEQSQNTALVLSLILAINSPTVGVHLRAKPHSAACLWIFGRVPLKRDRRCGRVDNPWTTSFHGYPPIADTASPLAHSSTGTTTRFFPFYRTGRSRRLKGQLPTRNVGESDFFCLCLRICVARFDNQVAHSLGDMPSFRIS